MISAGDISPYTSVRNPTLERPLRGTTAFLRDEWGFEAVYNVAVTPWMFLTPDIQVIGPSQKRRLVNGDTLGTATIGTATVLGVRLQLLLYQSPDAELLPAHHSRKRERQLRR